MQPVIFGISGYRLTDQEGDLFRRFPPCGFILFHRNIDTPEQAKELVHSLRDLTGREDMPILIDQEGGRVQRLRPPHWADLPNMRALGDLYKKDPVKGGKAVKLHARAIAGMLNELGINVVCAPVLDVPVDRAHDVIGKRAFAMDAQIVGELGAIMAQELIDCGVTPILKHIPGHGRAEDDSHYACPVVNADRTTLEKTDFYPFKHVVRAIDPMQFWAMTAHVVFTALDEVPVSVSKKALDFIRSDFGITGPLIPDAIEMAALGGTLVERALATLHAGCDLVLHCSGIFDEMLSIAQALPEISPQAYKRISTSLKIETAQIAGDWRGALSQLEKLVTIDAASTYETHEALTAA